MKVWILLLALLGSARCSGTLAGGETTMKLDSVLWRFCDQARMDSFSSDIIALIMTVIDEGPEYSLYDLNSDITSQFKVSYTQILTIEQEMEKVNFDGFFLTYLDFKIQLMIKLVTSTMTKAELKADSIASAGMVGKSSHKDFFVEMVKVYKLHKLNTHAINVSISQMIYLMNREEKSEPRKLFDRLIAEIKVLVCEVKKFLQKTDEVKLLDPESQDFLRIFFQEWIIFPSKDFLFEASCLQSGPDSKFQFQVTEFPYLQITKGEKRRREKLVEKPDKVVVEFPSMIPDISTSKVKILRLEQSLIRKNTAELSKPELLELFIEKYKPSLEWLASISNRDELNLYIFKDEVNIEELNEEHIANSFMLIHYIYLYLMAQAEKGKDLPTGAKEIYILILKTLAESDCWTLNPENVSKCEDLLEMIPYITLNRYITIILYILNHKIDKHPNKKVNDEMTFEQRTIKLFEKNTQLLIFEKDIKFLRISEGKTIPKKGDKSVYSIIQEKMVGSGFEDFKRLIEEKDAEVREVGFATPKYSKEVCEALNKGKDPKEQPITKYTAAKKVPEFKKEIESLFTFSDPLRLHTYKNIFNDCFINDTSFSSERTRIEEEFNLIIKKKRDGVAGKFKGFKLYLEHTLIPSRQMEVMKLTVKDQPKGMFTHDYQYFLLDRIKEDSRGISAARISIFLNIKLSDMEKGNTFEIPEGLLKNVKKYTYGHLWFMDVVGIFDFYLKKIQSREETTGLMTNDLEFAELFDDVYFALSVIRSQINAPVINSKFFLWNYLLNCMKVGESKATSEPYKFEGEAGFFDSPRDERCLVPADKARNLIFLFFAWQHHDEEIVAEFRKLQAELVEKKTIEGGLGKVLGFLASSKSLLSDSFAAFCKKTENGLTDPQQTTDKILLVCVATQFSRGVSDFLLGPKQDTATLLVSTSLAMEVFNRLVGDTKNILQVMMIDGLQGARLRADRRRSWQFGNAMAELRITDKRWTNLFDFDQKVLKSFYLSSVQRAEVSAIMAELVNIYVESKEFKEHMLIVSMEGEEVTKTAMMDVMVEFLLRNAENESFEKVWEALNEEQREKIFSFQVGKPGDLERWLSTKVDLNVKEGAEQVKLLIGQLNLRVSEIVKTKNAYFTYRAGSGLNTISLSSILEYKRKVSGQTGPTNLEKAAENQRLETKKAGKPELDQKKTNGLTVKGRKGLLLI